MIYVWGKLKGRDCYHVTINFLRDEKAVELLKKKLIAELEARRDRNLGKTSMLNVVGLNAKSLGGKTNGYRDRLIMTPKELV